MLRLALGIAFVVGVVAFAAPKLETAAFSGGAREEAASAVQSSGYRTITLEADRAGHFRVETVINGRRLTMMADTGATSVVLTAEDAARIGIRPRKQDFTVRMRTANGEAAAAPVTLKEIRVASIQVRNVRALVAQEGALDVNLLGMSFIGALKRFELKGDSLTLVQ